MPSFDSSPPRAASWVGRVGVVFWALGAVPLLLITFFSPGLRAEGLLGLVTMAWALVTVVLLVVAARRAKRYWILVAVQLLLIAGVLVETFSDARLYIGT